MPSVTNQLVVCIKNAKGLKDKDGLFSGKSDPYVRMRIVADDDHTQVVHIKETTVMGNARDPEWNETFKFSKLDTPGAYTLKLNVLDKDYLTRDDPLGETTIDLGLLTDSKEPQEFDDIWIDGFIWKAYLSVSLNTIGVWGNAEGSMNSLVVKVKRATGLREADSGISGKNDPYVMLAVTDAKGNAIVESQKTTVKEEGGTDVEWDEEFTFEGLTYPSANRLRLDVYDKDTLTRDDSLGHYILHLGVLKNLNDFIDYDVDLVGKSGGEAKLSFAVSNLGGWGHSKPPPPVIEAGEVNDAGGCNCALQ